MSTGRFFMQWVGQHPDGDVLAWMRNNIKVHVHYMTLIMLRYTCCLRSKSNDNSSHLNIWTCRRVNRGFPSKAHFAEIVAFLSPVDGSTSSTWAKICHLSRSSKLLLFFVCRQCKRFPNVTRTSTRLNAVDDHDRKKLIVIGGSHHVYPGISSDILFSTWRRGGH